MSMRRIVWLMLVALVWPAVSPAQGRQALESPGSTSLRAAAARPILLQPSGAIGGSDAARARRSTARASISGWSTEESITQQSAGNKKSALGWSIAAGAAAGLGMAGVGAARYGDNEGGTFCTRCFVEWSAVSIPVGAGIGAAVGYLIDRARR
jgi:hypothetical protein